MNISFDAQPLIDEEKTGVGFCQAGIIGALTKRHPNNCYRLEYFASPNPAKKAQRLRYYERENCRAALCRWFPGKLYRMMWSFLPVPYRFFFKTKSDVTHFFNFFVPPGVRGKRVVTVHDMGYKAYPKTVRLKTRVMLEISLRRSCKRADRIITDSEFSKREIIKYLGISNHKIVVAPCGVDHAKYQPQSNNGLIEATKQTYGITGPYFLYLGTLEPRKNIERMIQAYAAMKGQLKDAPLLVLAGRKGWLYEGIFQIVQELNMEQSILFTGYVRDDDAPVLLSGAMAFLFPSLYEGFGLPPLEAMACGTPVLTSNCASLPEVVGDAAILVNPYSVEDISQSMKKIATDEKLRKKLSQKGLAQASLFTWDRTADIVYRVYQELVDSKN